MAIKQTRRSFLKTGSVGILTAGAGAVAMPSIARAQTRSLTISTWGGDTEEAIKSFVMPEFEKEHDVKLVFDIGSMGARYNKIRAQEGLSTVDVFFSTDEPVYNGIKTDLFAEIDAANIPNIGDLFDWATPTDGYGVAYGLITYGLAHHTEHVETGPTEWNDLWRDDLRDKLALPALFHSNMPALLVKAAELAGGSAENLEPGLAKLAELKPKNLSYFWTAWAPLLKSGDIHAAAEFDYYVEGMKDNGYPVQWTNPSDKGFATYQHLSIPAASENKALAEAFLNAMLAPNVQEAIAKKTYQGPTNKKVKLPPEIAARSTYGDRLDNIRFFDGRNIDEKRGAISEMIKTQVLSHWE